MLKTMLASEIANLVGSRLVGADIRISGAFALDRPKPFCLGFAKTLTSEQAASVKLAEPVVLLVHEDIAGSVPCSHIPVRDPRLAFAKAIQAMRQRDADEISASAFVHPSAKIGKSVNIGPHAYVGHDVEIGDGSRIHANVVIETNVRIGKNCIIKSGTVIGQEGFGIAKDADGNNFRLPHIGGVVIEDNVEIGALNTVCSGTIEPTVVERYVKTDDHVHIAHNVRVGANSLLTACTEISGSVVIGPRSWLGPNCSIMNNISLGADVFVGLGSVVTKSLPAGAVAAGSPARIIRIVEPGNV
ncbi:MAG: DapH/DapD/GlmU-related protein [Rhizobiaceae bacterium]